MDREKVIKGLECCSKDDCSINDTCPYGKEDANNCLERLSADALALLKEQENLKEKLLRNIADNQLAVSPTGYETEEELAKRTGEWNGLQMAYEIICDDGELK